LGRQQLRYRLTLQLVLAAVTRLRDDNVRDFDGTYNCTLDSMTLLVREPLDRFQEIVSQSWKWRGGFCVPTDVTADPTVLPTPGLGGPLEAGIMHRAAMAALADRFAVVVADSTALMGRR
jgi:hypothetical protein